MSVVPCRRTEEVTEKIRLVASALERSGHTLIDLGLTEEEFHESGLFRGAVEMLRGRYAADMSKKREFVRRVLEHMKADNYIDEFEEVGSKNRHDYTVEMPSGKKCVIELKGGGDGNNTNIFERPSYAEEFVVWSVMQNASGDPRTNIWSGIHARLSAEIIDRKVLVDAYIAWDWICGTAGRPCPKASSQTTTPIGPYELTAPCIYLFPKTIPEPRLNPNPATRTLDDVEFARALHLCFGGKDQELNHVSIEAQSKGPETLRRTTVRREGEIAKQSNFNPIRRR
jgi:hypothetical protein